MAGGLLSRLVRLLQYNGAMKHNAWGYEAAAAYLRDNAALRAAVGAPQGCVLEPRDLGMGEHNVNYRFDVPGNGRSFVLRVNVATQPFHDDQVAYEFAALQALEPSGCTPKPFYLDNSPAALGEGAMVIQFCEGDQLDFDNVRPGDVRCAVQMMANVHAVHVFDDCPLFRPADPLHALFEECLQRYRVYRASAFEDARVTAWADRFIAATGQALDDLRAPMVQAHIVNTETLPSHFLIPARAAHEAAKSDAGAFCEKPGSFIDWERPVIGEVAQDVAFFTSPTSTFWDSEYRFSLDCVGDTVEAYWRAVDGRFERGDFDQRFHCWRMMTALRSTTWCCRALTVYHGGSQTHQTEKTAHKLPVYLSDDFMEMLARECFGL